MSGRRVDPLLVIGSALLVLTLALAALGAGSDAGADHGLTASVYDEGPGGAAAARRLIEALGGHTLTIEGDRFAPRADRARVLFMLHASELVTTADVAAVRAYLGEGGTVVVAHDLEIFIEPLLDAFDVHLASGASSKLTRLSGPLFVVPPAREIQADVGRELRLGTGWDALGSDGRGPTVAMRTEGRGTLIVVGTVAPFLSSGLASGDNARFVVGLAATALASGGTVAFDEYHHGAHPAPTLLAVVERTWLGRALVFAIAVAFLYVALTGRRLGPPQPLDPRPPRSSLEYVRGFAGLVRRAGRQEIVRDRLRRELETGLAREAGLDPATPFARVVEHLRVTSPSRADEAGRLDAKLRGRIRERDLVGTAARVATLLREEGS